jgi:hypothetical protein
MPVKLTPALGFLGDSKACVLSFSLLPAGASSLFYQEESRWKEFYILLR